MTAAAACSLQLSHSGAYAHTTRNTSIFPFQQTPIHSHRRHRIKWFNFNVHVVHHHDEMLLHWIMNSPFDNVFHCVTFDAVADAIQDWAAFEAQPLTFFGSSSSALLCSLHWHGIWTKRMRPTSHRMEELCCHILYVGGGQRRQYRLNMNGSIKILCVLFWMPIELCTTLSRRRI